MIRIFKLKNIISIKDFEREDIEYILDEAAKTSESDEQQEKQELEAREYIEKSRKQSSSFGSFADAFSTLDNN